MKVGKKLVLLSVALVILVAGNAAAVITGVSCVECHTMHNSQNSASMTNKVSFSLTDFRQQIKTTEKRDASSSFNAGLMLPFMATLQGSRSWSENLTTNSGGHENVSKRDYRTGGLVLSKPKLILGDFNLTLKSMHRTML